MKPVLSVLSILLVLAGSAVVIAWPALAQGPTVTRVEPSTGRPGEEFPLTVWGSGFEDAPEVELVIEDLEVSNVSRVSRGSIRADVSIPEGALPGPRLVQITAIFGQNEEFVGRLEDGFRVLAESPGPFVDGVEPQQVPQGSQVELNIFGGGFASGAWVEIEGEGVYVHEVGFMGSEHLVAFTEVEAGAPTGWRAVRVINPDEQAGELQRALEVVGEARATPAPTGPTDGGTPVCPWATGGGVVALGVGVAVGRALTLRTRLTWKRTVQTQWQVEAKTKLPEPKKICTWACKARVSADMLKGWQVTGLELTPYPQPGGKTPPAKRIVGKVLDPLTEAARPIEIAEDEAQTRQQVRQVAEALLDQVLAWEREGQTPASIRVDARLARHIKTQFKLYHCEQVDPKPDWVDSGIKWTGTLHRPGGRCLGVLRGPAAGEPDFASRARQELEDFLVQLVRSVRLKV